jgi:predicted aldo/keto reductase-like oxidoreductase
MKDFKPLNAQEQKIIQQAQRILGQSSTVPCTACHYCTEGCPMQIPIPEIFAALNLKLGNGQLDEAKKAYLAAAQEGHRASDCIECGQCEGACPQHLSIISLLKECKEME